jgi:AraC-like DNA-binding protein
MIEKEKLPKKMSVSFPAHDANSLLYVCDVGRHVTEPAHCYGPSVRSYYLIHLIEKGKGTVERNGVITHLSAGDAFIIYPDEVVTYTADEVDPWEYCWIGFKGAYSGEIMRKTTLELFPKYRKSGYVMLKNSTNSVSLGEIEGLSILFAVLDSIKSEKVENRDVVTLALEYIENNFFRPLDISQIASQLGLSRAHFTTVFTKTVGESPYNYLTKIRIKHAKEYLSSTTLSITEVAYSVGFASIERFSEQFKKYVELSPLAYRKSTTTL